MRASGLGSRRADARGFTLLEVVLAVAIFSLAITFFTVAYVNTLRAVSSVNLDQALEQDLAAARQQALLIADPDELEDGGDFLTGEHGMARWTAEYEPTDVADLFRVTLRVELDDPEAEERVESTQTLYLMRPSWSEPTEREALRSETRQRLIERQTNIGRERSS